MCFDDGAGIVVAGRDAVVHAGVAEGHRQCDTALHGGRQVIPAGAGTLPVAAAVVRMNARFDAVGHRTVRIFHVVQRTAAAQAAGGRNGRGRNGGRCAFAVIVLVKGDLAGVDVGPIIHCYRCGVGRHRQCRHHHQRQHKPHQFFIMLHVASCRGIS